MGFVEMAVIAVLLFITLEQAIAVAIFLLYCRRRPKLPTDAESPEVLVILALRGCDSTLANCVGALFRQDYPRYRVRVVVDHLDDPAWQVVHDAVERTGAGNVEVYSLRAPGSNCTLKCSALLQATADLPDEIEVVAFLDADVAPSPTWLRELVAPLARPGVEASMGNRWYSPRMGWWGSLARYLWNTSVVVTMFFWKVPWGGTLAVKADVLRQSNLRDLWSRAGCDDVPLFSILRQRRGRLTYVPTLLLSNEDDCTLTDAFRFITRQFLWVRLYHPVCWWTCAVFHAAMLGAQVLAVGYLFVALWGGQSAVAAALGGALLLNALGTLVMLAGLEHYASTVSGGVSPRRWHYWRRVTFAIPFTELFSLGALCQAVLRRRVEWRGITYDVRGPWRIRMREYVPIRGKCVAEESREAMGVGIGTIAGIPEESQSGV